MRSAWPGVNGALKSTQSEDANENATPKKSQKGISRLLRIEIMRHRNYHLGSKWRRRVE
jgi:hypothetical protein